MDKWEDNHVFEPVEVATRYDYPKKIRIGSRKSQLALFQANFVMDILKRKHPEIHYEIVSMTTTGDNILNVALSKIGEKSLFTKELEIALENGEVDIVVHSLKDLPTTLPSGMVIGAICKRASPFDAVVFRKNSEHHSLESLPSKSVIGTSSLRRIAQLRRFYPHLHFESIRGNLNTRFRKLDEDNHYSALILAVAGLERMDLQHRISLVLPPGKCMYAVGQGALAVECKENNVFALQILAEIADIKTTRCCIAERAFMRALEGGCSVPVAVSTTDDDQKLTLKGGVFSLDGAKSLIESQETSMKSVEQDESSEMQKPKVFCGILAPSMIQKHLHLAEELGINLANSFLNKGAKEILAEARQQNGNA